LALSTFRRSDEAVRQAIELAAHDPRELVVVFVIDKNLARYFIGTDAIAGTKLRERCERDLLEEHRREGQAAVDAIAAEAKECGVECESAVLTGRFAVEVLKAVEGKTPEMVVTTRSKRPQWVRRFFGSPVDYLIANAGCLVIEI